MRTARPSRHNSTSFACRSVHSHSVLGRPCDAPTNQKASAESSARFYRSGRSPTPSDVQQRSKKAWQKRLRGGRPRLMCRLRFLQGPPRALVLLCLTHPGPPASPCSASSHTTPQAFDNPATMCPERSQLPAACMLTGCKSARPGGPPPDAARRLLCCRIVALVQGGSQGAVARTEQRVSLKRRGGQHARWCTRRTQRAQRRPGAGRARPGAGPRAAARAGGQQAWKRRQPEAREGQTEKSKGGCSGLAARDLHLSPHAWAHVQAVSVTITRTAPARRRPHRRRAPAPAPPACGESGRCHTVLPAAHNGAADHGRSV